MPSVSVFTLSRCSAGNCVPLCATRSDPHPGEFSPAKFNRNGENLVAVVGRGTLFRSHCAPHRERRRAPNFTLVRHPRLRSSWALFILCTLSLRKGVGVYRSIRSAEMVSHSQEDPAVQTAASAPSPARWRDRSFDPRRRFELLTVKPRRAP